MYKQCEDQRHKLFLLILLNRMGVEFSVTHGYIHTTPQVLGVERVREIDLEMYISTEDVWNTK